MQKRFFGVLAGLCLIGITLFVGCSSPFGAPGLEESGANDPAILTLTLFDGQTFVAEKATTQAAKALSARVATSLNVNGNADSPKQEFFFDADGNLSAINYGASKYEFKPAIQVKRDTVINIKGDGAATRFIGYFADGSLAELGSSARAARAADGGDVTDLLTEEQAYTVELKVEAGAEAATVYLYPETTVSILNDAAKGSGFYKFTWDDGYDYRVYVADGKVKYAWRFPKAGAFKYTPDSASDVVLIPGGFRNEYIEDRYPFNQSVLVNIDANGKEVITYDAFVNIDGKPVDADIVKIAAKDIPADGFYSFIYKNQKYYVRFINKMIHQAWLAPVEAWMDGKWYFLRDSAAEVAAGFYPWKKAADIPAEAVGLVIKSFDEETGFYTIDYGTGIEVRYFTEARTGKGQVAEITVGEQKIWFGDVYGTGEFGAKTVLPKPVDDGIKFITMSYAEKVEYNTWYNEYPPVAIETLNIQLSDMTEKDGVLNYTFTVPAEYAAKEMSFSMPYLYYLTQYPAILGNEGLKLEVFNEIGHDGVERPYVSDRPEFGTWTWYPGLVAQGPYQAQGDYDNGYYFSFNSGTDGPYDLDAIAYGITLNTGNDATLDFAFLDTNDGMKVAFRVTIVREYAAPQAPGTLTVDLDGDWPILDWKPEMDDGQKVDDFWFEGFKASDLFGADEAYVEFDAANPPPTIIIDGVEYNWADLVAFFGEAVPQYDPAESDAGILVYTSVTTGFYFQFKGGKVRISTRRPVPVAKQVEPLVLNSKQPAKVLNWRTDLYEKDGFWFEAGKINNWDLFDASLFGASSSLKDGKNNLIAEIDLANPPPTVTFDGVTLDWATILDGTKENHNPGQAGENSFLVYTSKVTGFEIQFKDGKARILHYYGLVPVDGYKLPRIDITSTATYEWLRWKADLYKVDGFWFETLSDSSWNLVSAKYEKVEIVDANHPDTLWIDGVVIAWDTIINGMHSGKTNFTVYTTKTTGFWFRYKDGKLTILRVRLIPEKGWTVDPELPAGLPVEGWFGESIGAFRNFPDPYIQAGLNRAAGSKVTYNEGFGYGLAHVYYDYDGLKTVDLKGDALGSGSQTSGPNRADNMGEGLVFTLPENMMYQPSVTLLGGAAENRWGGKVSASFEVYFYDADGNALAPEEGNPYKYSTISVGDGETATVSFPRDMNVSKVIVHLNGGKGWVGEIKGYEWWGDLQEELYHGYDPEAKKAGRYITVRDGGGRTFSQALSTNADYRGMIYYYVCADENTLSNMNIVAKGPAAGNARSTGFGVVEGNTKLTLNNVSVDAIGASVAAWRDNNTVIINGGTFSGSCGEDNSMIFLWGNNNTVTVTGATFNLDTTVNHNAGFVSLKGKGNKVTFVNCTFFVNGQSYDDVSKVTNWIRIESGAGSVWNAERKVK